MKAMHWVMVALGALGAAAAFAAPSLPASLQPVAQVIVGLAALANTAIGMTTPKVGAS